MALKLIFEKKDFMVTLAGNIEPWDNGEPIQAIVGRKINLKSIGNARQFTIQRNGDPALRNEAARFGLPGGE